MNLSYSPIIIDTGQYQTRVGVSNNNFPQLVTNTLLYENVCLKEIKLSENFFNHRRSIFEDHLNAIFLNDLKSQGLNRYSLTVESYENLNYPFKYLDGLDWNLLETFWTDIITRELYYDTTMYPILLSEPHNAPFDFRDNSMEFFFESLSIPSIKIIPQEVLSVSAIQENLPYLFYKDNGKGSVGIVIHFGDSSIRILPIASGYLLSEYIGTLNLGGFSITQLLMEEFNVFENNSFVSHQSMNKIKSLGLFDDYISNKIVPLLCDEIAAVVKKCPVDYTRLLLKNIVFIGGASINCLLASHFEKYFKDFLRQMNINVNDISVKSLVHSSSRKEKIFGIYSTWLGGYYSTRKEDFVKNHFFSKEQYQEYGSCAIRRLSNKDFLSTA